MTQPKPIERDVGLDFIRALALILMVFIHYWRLIPDVSESVKLLKFIGESAPAFFFFAFGMTMGRFLDKSHREKLVRLTSFLYISLIHNIFVAKTFVTGYFFFLWTVQILFYILHTGVKKSIQYHVFILSATVILMFILPFQSISSFFSKLIPGHFPILPWGLFVISGYLFSIYGNSKETPGNLFPIVLLCIATACLLIHLYHPDYKNLIMRKWPLSGPYFILFSGISIFIVNLTRRHKKKLLTFPLLYRPVIFISKYLLIAVVLSYISSAPFMKILTLFFPSDFIIEHALLFLIAGAIFCILIQLILMKIVLAFWEGYKKLNVFRWSHDHFDSIAIGSIIICSIGMGITRYTLQGPGSYFFGHNGFLNTSRVIGQYDFWLLASFFFLLFFSLTMMERRAAPVTGQLRIKKNITIMTSMCLIAFSTQFYPAVAEEFFLMQTPYQDTVPQEIKQMTIDKFKNNDITISHLKPVDNIYILTDGLIVAPYRCIVRKTGDETVAIDSVIFFSFLNSQDYNSFTGTKLVSYQSYSSDLVKGGRLLVKEELTRLFSNESD